VHRDASGLSPPLPWNDDMLGVEGVVARAQWKAKEIGMKLIVATEIVLAERVESGPPRSH